MSAQARKLQAAFDLLSVICNEVADEMPIRQALALVSVALRSSRDGYAEVKDVAEDTRSNGAVASRDLLVLSAQGRGTGKPGYDLIAVDMGAIGPTAPGRRADLRRRPYVLNKRGKEVADKIAAAL